MPAHDDWNPIERLAADADRNGHVTLADLPGWLGELFFIPGDGLLWMLVTYAPGLAQFLEISPTDYGGTLAAFLSTCAWLTTFVAGSIAYQWVLDADRRLTRAVGGLFKDSVMRARIASKLLRQRWRQWLTRSRPTDRLEFAEDVELAPLQLRALELHSELAAGYALPVRETAGALDISVRATQDMLDKLKSLGLLERTIGGADGESAYKLAAAGRALLMLRRLSTG